MKRLIKIQQELKAPKDKRNNFGKFNYRSASDILEAVKPLLKSENLSLVMEDGIQCIGNVNFLYATVYLYDGEGKLVANTSACAEISNHTGMSKDQCTGAASSYARKYALCGLFAIDDSSLDPDGMDNTPVQGAPAPDKPAARVNTTPPAAPTQRRVIPAGTTPASNPAPAAPSTPVDIVVNTSRDAVIEELNKCKTSAEAKVVLSKHGVDIKAKEWRDVAAMLNDKFFPKS